MNLLKSSPFRELEDVIDRLKRVLWRSRIFWRPRAEPHEMSAAGDWMPPVYISETDTAYLIKAEIPEVKKEDVRVTVRDGTLTIQGERKLENKGRKLSRVIPYGRFVQRFRLPADTDEATVESEFRDGFMHVTLPKSGKAEFRAANIAVS